MKHKLLQWGAAIIALIMATACSNSKTEDLLKQVPENANLVMVGDVKTILESAGCHIENGKLKLSKEIDELLSNKDIEDLDEFNEFLKDCGVNTDAIAMVNIKFEGGRPITLFAIDDNKKFISKIEDNGYSEKDDDAGSVLYSKKTYESSYDPEYDDYSYVVINGSYGYYISDVWVKSDFKPLKAVNKMIEDSKEGSYAKTTFGKYITSGNAGGIAIKIPKELKSELKEQGMPSSIANMYEGVVAMKFDLEEDKAECKIKWFDSEGKAKNFKEYSDYYNSSAKIDAKALKYLGKDESIVMASCLKDVKWDKALGIYEDMLNSASDRATLGIIGGYLKKIDGTIAIGFGLTNGYESLVNLTLSNDVLNNISVTIVVETKDGKAKGLVSDLQSLAEEARLPIEEEGGGFTIEVPGDQGNLYVKADGNYLVLANHAIKENANNTAVKEIDFSDYIYCLGMAFNKDNQLLKDLNVSNDIKAYLTLDLDDAEGEIEAKISGGTTKGFIAKVIKIATDIKGKSKDLDEKYNEIRTKVYGTSYDDVYMDSVVVAEEYWDDYDEVVAVDSVVAW